MKIVFTDSEYKVEHGKAPRGRGWWFFTFEGAYEFCHIGAFSEAKKKCKEYIKEVAPAGCTRTVYVNVEP